MSQLSQLVSFLNEALPERLRGFDSWIDNQKLTPSYKALGNDQYRLTITTYDGVIELDKFPYRQIDPGVVYAMVEVWIIEHANELRSDQGISGADIDAELYDEESALVTITVPLIDELVIAPDENGMIPFMGKKWSVVTPLYDVAESAEIYGADSTGAAVGGQSE